MVGWAASPLGCTGCGCAGGGAPNMLLVLEDKPFGDNTGLRGVAGWAVDVAGRGVAEGRAGRESCSCRSTIGNCTEKRRSTRTRTRTHPTPRPRARTRSEDGDDDETVPVLCYTRCNYRD